MAVMHLRRALLAVLLAAAPALAGEALVDAVDAHLASHPDGSAAHTFDRSAYTDDLSSLPIGVFDSGIGGLTVLEAILTLDDFHNDSLKPGPDGRPDFENERFVYLGDQANMPYGNYPKAGKTDLLRQHILEDAIFLLGNRYHAAGAVRHDKPPVKAIVIACNTATAYGLEDVRSAVDRWRLPVLVVGVVEAGARGVLEAAPPGAIGVLATVGTCDSGVYPRTIRGTLGLAGRRDPPVTQQGSADLAAVIEGDPSRTVTVGDQVATDVRRLVEAHRDAPAGAEPTPLTTIVLGCTHFPLVEKEIDAAFAALREDPAFAPVIAPIRHYVDPAKWTARQLFRDLAAARLRRRDPAGHARDRFFLSVPNPAAPGVRLDARGGLTEAYKHGREPGRFLEDTLVVPLTRRLLPTSGRTLVSEKLPAVWERLDDEAAVAPVVEGYAASVHPLATQAALDAFAAGGNAIDAAVAAGLTLGVVDGHNSGIGGGCFILMRLADGRLVCLDGRETAPAAARRDMFLRDGEVVDALSRTGPLASGVPGALAAYADAVERFGRLPLAAACAAGIRHAEDGFPIDAVYARKLKATAADLAAFPAAREVFLQADGSPWPAGHVLLQKDLARTYRAIAAEGTAWFYRGAFAADTAAYMTQAGGLLTAADFRGYEPIERQPLVSRYRGWTIVGFPPPSSGGVHIAQMLNMLEAQPAADLRAGSAMFAHRVIETMKLAFADRAHWLGDPAFADVPTGLISTDYAHELAARIDPLKATPVPEHGQPPDWQSDHFHKHTTHFAASDAEGNWVSITATINTAFGSKVVVPGTGVLLNNEMDDFAVAPGVPNHFGLVGGEANCVAPGKRPLSSMSPTLVLDAAGEPVMSIGAAGGPTIITQVLLGLLHSLDHGMPPAEALAQPRVHHQWRPDRVKVEEAAGDELAAALEALGHDVRREPAFGACQIIRRDSDGRLGGASDPRVGGSAAGTER
jgi:gamma-glutamyltranspeptidase / glutathione hydrolase